MRYHRFYRWLESYSDHLKYVDIQLSSRAIARSNLNGLDCFAVARNDTFLIAFIINRGISYHACVRLCLNDINVLKDRSMIPYYKDVVSIYTPYSSQPVGRSAHLSCP